jgi:CBS domain-containing protein
MKIKDVMTRDVSTCRADDSTSHAARLMWENDCGVVPVVDAQLRPIGMITDRDVCMAGYTTGRSLADIRVGDVMSRDVKTCSPEDAIGVAELSMQQRHVRRLPVVDSRGRLVGILSLNDLARGAARHDEESDGDLALDKVGETLASVCTPWCEIGAPSASRGAQRGNLVSVPAATGR